MHGASAVIVSNLVVFKRPIRSVIPCDSPWSRMKPTIGNGYIRRSSLVVYDWITPVGIRVRFRWYMCFCGLNMLQVDVIPLAAGIEKEVLCIRDCRVCNNFDSVTGVPTARAAP